MIVFALSLFLITGCGLPDPLKMGVETSEIVALQALEDWGKLLLVQVSIENKGDAAMHVFTDMLDVVGENGSRGSVRAFRDRYRFELAKAPDAARRKSLTALFAEIGVAEEQARQLFSPQLEILPGETLHVILPFMLKEDNADSRYVLHFAYHDDATDRVRRESLPLMAKRKA
ncbi:MAG: hypothetical protein LBE33_00595 [Zoogloeaceae bacterium]|nr:hypothetical protein [Zoogloeaceae bacterium]